MSHLHSYNSNTDLNLGSVPDILDTESPILYRALLDIHTALEILATSFDDVDTGFTVDVTALEAYVAARTNVITVTADYSVTVLNGTILIDSTTGAVTVTLPTAVGISGTRYVVKHIVAGNLGGVSAFGAEEIDGETVDFELFPDESITLQSDGANWRII